MLLIYFVCCDDIKVGDFNDSYGLIYALLSPVFLEVSGICFGDFMKPGKDN